MSSKRNYLEKIIRKTFSLLRHQLSTRNSIELSMLNFCEGKSQRKIIAKTVKLLRRLLSTRYSAEI